MLCGMLWFIKIMRAGVTAVRTLTALPCPGRDAAQFADALPWFPLVGALLGALIAGLFAILAPLTWPLGAAALAVLANVLLTRAIHVDGLADMADALGGGRTPERRLEIMKDSCNGAFGVTAIVLNLLLKTVAFARLAELQATGTVIVVFILARTAQAVIASSLPYARANGCGTAAPFVAGATRRHALIAALIAASLITWLAHSNPLALAGMTIAAGLVAVLAVFYRRKFGGVTGDLIGATNEIVETSLLLLAAVAGSSLITVH